MKKFVNTIDVEEEGFLKLLGDIITIFCANYFYTGKLIGVNDDCVLIEDPSIIYETGSFGNDRWKDCQSLCCKELFIQKSAIESFGVMK